MNTTNTVTGEIPIDDIGITLTHEHFIIDTQEYKKPEGWSVVDTYDWSAVDRNRASNDLTLENLWRARENDRIFDNNRLDDIDTAMREAYRYVDNGGKTVVDVTSYGLCRDVRALQQISRRAGLNIIAGTGYYVSDLHPRSMDDKTAGDIADEIVSDIEDGMDGTQIQAGIIGEIGTSKGFVENDNEQKSVRGAAIAQQRTGAPITVHPPLFQQEEHDVLDVLKAAGADLTNVIIGHQDGTIRNDDSLEYHKSIANRGPMLEFDLFGAYGYTSAGKPWPLDEDRIIHIRDLIGEGYGDQIVISQDVCSKVQLTSYGGHGYGHILRNIVPRMREHNFPQSHINKLLVENPKNCLVFNK